MSDMMRNKRRARSKRGEPQLTPGLVLGSPWESPIGGNAFGGRKKRKKSPKKIVGFM